MPKRTLTCLVMLMTMTAIASAEIYKCVNEDGVVKFSDQPCGRQAEVVIAKTNLSVDEAIGNGGPYPEPVKDSAVMNQDIMVHAKTVGASIFPDMYLESNDIGEDLKGQTRTWKVFLVYLDSKNYYNNTKVELNYSGERVGERIFVRLHYMRLAQFRWAEPLTTLKKAKKVKQDLHYGWYVLPQRK